MSGVREAGAGPVRALWWLNLDGEFELALGRPPTASASRLRQMERARERLRGGLLAAGDELLGPGEEPRLPAGLVATAEARWAGIPWLPTPSALRAFAAVGVACVQSPSPQVLKRVCDRAFLHELDGGLAGSVYLRSIVQVLAHLGASRGQSWLAKRAFGMAGIGQRRLTGGPQGPADRTWLEASLRLGGLRMEPLVHIESEWSLHALLDEAGALRMGEPRRQIVDARGLWTCEASETPAGSALGAEPSAELRRAGREVARALFEAGYFGPFGVDAYAYAKSPGGALSFQALGEVNARLTMAWSSSMGPARAALDWRACSSTATPYRAHWGV